MVLEENAEGQESLSDLRANIHHYTDNEMKKAVFGSDSIATDATSSLTYASSLLLRTMCWGKTILNGIYLKSFIHPLVLIREFFFIIFSRNG